MKIKYGDGGDGGRGQGRGALKTKHYIFVGGGGAVFFFFFFFFFFPIQWVVGFCENVSVIARS